MKFVLRSVIWAFAFLAATQGSAAQRPNILFIYTDDHSHRTIGCYDESYPFVRTPNIDQVLRRTDAGFADRMPLVAAPHAR